jgi:hypothetical protein
MPGVKRSRSSSLIFGLAIAILGVFAASTYAYGVRRRAHH